MFRIVGSATTEQGGNTGVSPNTHAPQLAAATDRVRPLPKEARITAA
jgi:hypothetical protein